MDELKDYLKEGFSEDNKNKAAKVKDTSATDKKNIELAKLYEDTAEYEAELKVFEEELEIIKENELKDIPAEFAKKFPDEDRDYEQELQNILSATWSHLAEVKKTHSSEYLELITQTPFCDVLEKFNATYPEYDRNFETEVRNIFVQRWETLISIKKEHIKEEETDMKIAGLKPSFVKRIYKQIHGSK
ncbi:hypothetical protein N9A28_07670 [Sulfurimonas sp.]|nr:hypothetical protein [Sulfurimonas sp.]